MNRLKVSQTAMKRFIFLAAVFLFVGVWVCTPASADEEFHSEFGILPPEIPAGSGITADALDSLIERIDQPSLPPAFRQRMIYEWLMQKVNFDPSDSFMLSEETGPEAVSVCAAGAVKVLSAGDAGFALLAHYLMERIGFPTVIITGELVLPDGNTRPHQWNYVFYAGKWYHFDPLGEKENPALNGFMNVQKELQDSPLKWEESTLPESAGYPVKAIGCACSF